MAAPGPDPSTTLEDTLDLFRQLDDPSAPMTASEVGDRLGCARRTAFGKLEALEARGDLKSKKTGARGRVWWRPADRGTADDLGRSQFESFVRAVVDYAIFTLTPDGRVDSWNAGAHHIKGYEADEIIGEHFSRFYTPDDADAGVPERNLERAREAGRVEDEGWRVRRDGTRFWANVVITAIRDDDGELQGFTKVTRDMTDHREREAALRRERDLLNEVLETGAVGIAVIDRTGEIVRANERAGALLGVQGSDLEGQTVGHRAVYDDRGEPIPPAERPSRRALRTGEAVENEPVRVEPVDGEPVWLSVNATPLADDAGDVERVVLAAEDVTALKAEASALERERDELRAELDEVFERVDEAFYALDQSWRFTYVNDRAEEIIGRSASAVLGERIWDVFPETADGVVWDRYHEAMETQRPVSFELYYEPLDVWVEVAAYPSESGLSVYFRDVTERVERERAIEEQRERYRGLVESAPVAICIITADGELGYVNEAALDLVGADEPAEVVGEPANAFVHPDDRPGADAGFSRVIDARERTPATELRIVGADGIREAMVNSVPITYEGEPASQTVLVDITEQKRREAQLALLDRLNGVVQEVTHSVIDSRTRAEIEELVCQRLAATDSYAVAWIGSIGRDDGRLVRRAAAGAADYLDGLTVSIDRDPSETGPTADAARTGDIYVAQRLKEQGGGEPWRVAALDHGLRAIAAIPISHEGTMYGVLTLGSARPTAFDEDESDVIVGLGEVVGHAITALERKRALVSEEVVELRLRIRNLLGTLESPSAGEGTVSFDRTVPLDDERFLAYGRVTGEGAAVLDALIDRLDHFESVSYLDEGAPDGRFELQLAGPPVLDAIASHGGRVESAVIADGDYELTVHVPSATDIRALVGAARSRFPATEVVAQRRTTRDARPAAGFDDVVDVGLTDRQRSALEAAYFGGFFDWPRGRTGEQIADSLRISPSTFHQHVRTGERKLMRALLEDG